MPIWLSVVFLTLNIMAVAGGLPGWLVCCGVLFMANMTLWVAYALLMLTYGKKKQRDAEALEKAPKPQLPVMGRTVVRDNSILRARIHEKRKNEDDGDRMPPLASKASLGGGRRRTDSEGSSSGSERARKPRRAEPEDSSGYDGYYSGSDGYADDGGAGPAARHPQRRAAVDAGDRTGVHYDAETGVVGSRGPRGAGLGSGATVEVEFEGNVLDLLPTGAARGPDGVELDEEESKNFWDLVLGVPKARPARKDYQSIPKPFGTRQKRVMYWTLGTLVILSLVTTTGFFGLPLPFYKVWVPDKGRGSPEITPNAVVAKTNVMMYTFPKIATTLRLNLANVWLTTACGKRFNRKLTEPEKRIEILNNFIDLYDIDMSVYERPEYSQYETVNDWFSRTIRPALRPITGSSSSIVAPADARYIIYPATGIDLQIWLKGEEFTPNKLIGDTKMGSKFNNGPIIIARLAPQDYHRFHSPVDGTIVSVSGTLPGPLHSVNFDAIRSNNDAIFNQRIAIIISSQNNTRLVAYVAIGAVCVGSVTITKAVGQNITRGDELGYFAFGGSTTVTLFEQGAADFDPSVIQASRMPVESLIPMGTTIGTFV
jgi:phosphatidylserine decarboxylase precursor